MNYITELSIAAEAVCQEKGYLAPLLRRDLEHLPVRRHGNVCVFDETRMTPEQRMDVIDALEKIVGTERAVNVGFSVQEYMRAYGRWGVRVKDLMEQLGASKPPVLKALRELAAAGNVEIREEDTRGPGSKRKRYYWIAVEEPLASTEGLVQTSILSKWDTGIRYHGTATQGVTCFCGYCKEAAIEALIAERVSAARAAGRSGLAEGLSPQTQRLAS